MKKLLILILISSIYSTESVVVKLINGDEKVIEFIKIHKGIIYYYPNENVENFKLRVVEKLNLSDISWMSSVDGKYNYNYYYELNAKSISEDFSESNESINKFKPSGLILAGGALLLRLNLESECDECGLEELDDFSNRLLVRTKLGYSLLVIGSLILALGY